MLLNTFWMQTPTNNIFEGELLAGHF